MINLRTPYLLFLGDAKDDLAAKTAQGIWDWKPEWCVGQMRLPECAADLGIEELGLEDAYERGARTLVIGVATRGGFIPESWIPMLVRALEIGYDIAAGLHHRLTDIGMLADRANELGRSLFDVRHSSDELPVGNGENRQGKRLVPVGTDCSCGKMYTALAAAREMSKRGMSADFRATGQTGIFVAGSGISIDAVVADFMSGAVESISPASDNPNHWDIVEGQGSLFHPSFAGVSTAILHGSQPDALVLCHEPTREHMRGTPHYPIPDIEDCMNANLNVARLTNPNVKFVGMAINTAKYEDQRAKDYLAELEQRYNLPATDPFRYGIANIIDQVQTL